MANVITINDMHHLNQLIAENNNLVLDFFAEWCGPCKMLLPVLDDVSNENKDIVICKVNVDNNATLATQYNVRSIPTVIYFKDGEVKDRTMGFLPKDKFLDQLNKVYKSE
jgi:thioredoxin 1